MILLQVVEIFIALLNANQAARFRTALYASLRAFISKFAVFLFRSKVQFNALACLFGATQFLKTNFFVELLPPIMQHCSHATKSTRAEVFFGDLESLLRVSLEAGSIALVLADA